MSIEEICAQASTVESLAAGYQDVNQIVDLCSLAQKPELAAIFIHSGKTAAEVLKYLVAAYVPTR